MANVKVQAASDRKRFRLSEKPSSSEVDTNYLTERRVYDRQRAVVRNICHFSQTKHAAELVCRNILDWPRRRRGAGRRLGKRGRSRRVKGDVAFDFLQDLMNVAVQHRYRSEPLQIGESLSAILCPPT